MSGETTKLNSQTTPSSQPADGRAVISCGVLLRFSSLNQSTESCDTQLSRIRSEAERDTIYRCTHANDRLVISDTHVWRGEAVSGRSQDRPELEAAKRAIRAKEIQALLVLDTSRAARRIKTLMSLVELADFYGCEVCFVLDRLSTGNPAHRKMLLMKGLIDETSNDMHAERTVAYMTARAEAGLSLGSLPYGYTSEATQTETRKGREVPSHFKIIIHAERSAIVRRIFSEYASGLGQGRIAKGLNQDGIPSPGQSHLRDGRVGGWSQRTVASILKNARYVGLWRWRMTKAVTNPDTGQRAFRARPQHEHVDMGPNGFIEDLRVVDGQTWEVVQRRIEETTRKRVTATDPSTRIFGQRKTSEADHILSGRLRCGGCGSNFVLVSGAHGGGYGCFQSHGKGTCPIHQTVQRVRVEAAVLQVVRGVLEDDAVVRAVADRYNALLRNQIGSGSVELDRLRHERDKQQTQAHRLVDYIAEGTASPTVRERLEQAEAQLSELSQKIVRLESARRDPLLLTSYAVRRRLGEVLALLEGDPVRARPVLAKLFPEPLRLHLVLSEGKRWGTYEVEGVVVVQANGEAGDSPVAKPFRVRAR